MKYTVPFLLWIVSATLVESQQPKDTRLRDGVSALAESLRKMDKAETTGAKAKELFDHVKQIDVVMNLFKPRGRGGVGFGPPRGLDGIEYFLTQNAFLTPTKTVTDKLDMMTDNLADLGWKTVAVGELLRAVDADKKFGKKAETWKKAVAGLQSPSRQLIQDAAAKKPGDMLVSLQKIHEACTFCHYHFRQ